MFLFFFLFLSFLFFFPMGSQTCVVFSLFMLFSTNRSKGFHILYSSMQIQQEREKAEKAQQLLQNVAIRKRNRQLETGGLVITKAVYGNQKALNESREGDDQLASEIVDVTLPLNFLVNDSGKLKVCFFCVLFWSEYMYTY